MRARFSFGYGATLSAAQRTALEEEVGAEIQVDDDAPDKPKTYCSYSGDLERVLNIALPSAKIEITETIEAGVLLQISEQLERLGVGDGTVTAKPDEYVNTKVDVHVPGLGLLAIDEIKVVEDACTDALQEDLDAGWRIVAACPQPDSRRPDYVLGRMKVPA